MAATKADRVLARVRAEGIVRPRDLAAEGISHQYLQSLHRRGLLARSRRGLYTLPDAAERFDEHAALAEVAKRVPHGVICLLSALRFHDLTTQAPFEVWVAIEHSAYVPRDPDAALPLRVVYFSGAAFTAGIEEHHINGGDGARVQPGQDRRGLLQVPQQDRAGRGAGGAARDLARAAGDDGRAVALRQGLPRGQRDAPLSGVRQRPGGVGR